MHAFPRPVAAALLLGTAVAAGGTTGAAATPTPEPATLRYTSSEPLDAPLWTAVPCSDAYTADAAYAAGASGGCLPTAGGTHGCGRYIQDGLFSEEEVDALKAMVRAGMARSRVEAGPTILDLNTGFMRDRVLQNIYRPQRLDGVVLPAVNYTDAQFQLYGSVYERIHARLRAVFGLATLHFTAPTFVTRIRGAPDWQPASAHDEYFHTHSDKANTDHYDYSGLVYLSTGGGRDFTGGDFHFSRPADDAAAVPPPPDADDAAWVPEHTVQPRAGRLLLFTSGTENMHNLDLVTGGERFVFSMWFSCHPGRRFTTFLDGRAHVCFDGGDSELASTSTTNAGVRIGHDADIVYTDVA